MHLPLALALVWLCAAVILHFSENPYFLAIWFCYLMIAYNSLRWLVVFVVPWYRQRRQATDNPPDDPKPAPRVADPEFDFSIKPKDPPPPT